MKSDFHFHFYSRIVIMAVLAFSLFLLQKSVDTTAQSTPPYDVSGWAWSEVAGWLSLNCYNDFTTPGVYEDRCGASGSATDYGLGVVEVGSSTYIDGCAWAGNSLSPGGDPLGWICFSNTTSSNGIATSTTYVNALDPSYFASIETQEQLGNEAWKLGFPIFSDASADIDAPSAGNPIEGCFNCFEEYDYECSIDSNACTSDSECPDVGDPPTSQTCSVITNIYYNCDNCLEYSYYSGRCENSGNICQDDEDCEMQVSERCAPISTCLLNIEQECTSDPNVCLGGASNCIVRDLGSLKKVLGAYECSDCSIESYDNRCNLNSFQDNINSCQSCNQVYYAPGVMVDHKHYNIDYAGGERAQLCGWAWNAWDDPNTGGTYGMGWFQFAPRVVTTTRPYISAEGGSIYSKGDIRGRYLPPYGYYNASYIIESGGSITNFVSSSTFAGLYQGELPYRPAIDFFSLSGGKYSNALGAIDYDGLTAKLPGGNLNKFGYQVVIVGGSGADIPLLIFASDFAEQDPFRGKVYHVFGDLNVSATAGLDVTVRNSEGIRSSGTIVIEGDLTFSDNVIYQNTLGNNLDNLQEIPSLVWIVKGDLIIPHDVSTISGTFIILGDGTSCSPTPTAGCGRFVSCDGDAAQCAISPLTVYGNVIARYFDLGRTYVNPASITPSERFVNDGRLQANPPPGFEDFSNVIPRFSENP